MATRNSEIVAKIRASRAQFKTDLEAARKDLQGWKQRSEKDTTAVLRMRQAATASGPGSAFGSAGAGGGGGGGGMFGSAWRTGAAAATVAVGGIAAAAAKVDLSMEDLLNRLASVSDGTETLKKQMQELVKIAEKPGISFETAIEQSASLQASGMSPAESRRAIEVMGNAGARTGASSADVREALINLTQLYGESGDQQDIKDTEKYIKGFRKAAESIAGTGEKAKYGKTFVSKLLDELAQLSPAAGTAQTKLDKLKDEAKMLIFDATGGRVADAIGKTAESASSMLKGIGASLGLRKGDAKEFFEEGAVKMGGAMKSLKGDGPPLLDRLELSPKDVESRRKALLEREEQQKRQEEARVDHMRKEFRDRNEILSLEVDMARAIEAHDRDALATLEDRRDVLENAAKLAKQYNVSEEAAAEAIKSANNARRIMQEDEQARQAKKTLADAQAETNIRELRNRGRDRAADRAEADRTETARVQQLRDQNVPEAAAREQAARERTAAKGGGRIRGAKYDTGTGKRGLDALKDLNNTDGGGSALDRNAAEMEAAANKRKEYADGTMADMFKPVIGFDGATSGAKKTATVEDKLSAPGVSSDKTMETAMKAALQLTNALLEKIVPPTAKKSEPQKR